MRDLIDGWYEILWYDGMVINHKWTMSPVYLIFDFSRENNLGTQKNRLAMNYSSIMIW
jgi:hypothetical protein